MRISLALLICVILASGQSFSQNTFPSSGNAGIGTTTPAAEMHVKATGNPRVTVQSTSSSGAPGYSMGNPTSPSVWTMHYNIASQFLGFHFYGIGNRAVITNSGRMGIGTDVPKTSLDIAGDLHIGTFDEMPAEGDASMEEYFGNYILGDYFGGQKLKLGVANDFFTRAEILLDNNNRPDGTIAFKTAAANGGATTRMFINGDGNVSIGTTDAKGYRFAVNGDAMFTKVNVKAHSAWPDYVFDGSYKLRSLAEVEKYIQDNKHLPEVPSAAQVEKEGIDVASTQTIMMKKIEELTLYVIEQNKRLDAQNDRLARQEKVINQQQLEIEKLKKY